MKYQKIKKYKYKLSETFTIQTSIKNNSFKHKFFTLKDSGILVINKGYLWDGVSGPTWDTKSTMIPGLVHDAFYQAIRLELLPLLFKEEVDTVFYELMIYHKVWKTRACYFYKAVKEFGHNSCVPGNIKIPKVIEV